MIILMTSSILAYLVLVFLSSRRVLKEVSDQMSAGLLKYSTEFKQLVDKKEDLLEQKIVIKEELYKIFTLYEMTKDMTQTLHHDQAFEVFKQKLNQHIVCKSCDFYSADSLKIDTLKNQKDTKDIFIFPLVSERKTIGFLVVIGMNPADRDKFAILGHQFALVSRRIQLYEELEDVAITDGLTEIYNRRYLMQRLNEEWQRSQKRKTSMSLLMVDVDHFKKINDELGHLTGDQVLHQVAKIIKENIREIDIAGRFGGEEFCVVLVDTDRQGAILAAERIRLAIAKDPLKAYDNSVSITVSAGTATFPNDTLKTSDLIDHADQALYMAKHHGRNQVRAYSAKMN